MLRLGLIVSVGLLACNYLQAQNSSASVGIFNGHSDVGTVLHTGSVEFDSQTDTYRVTGSGENMWAATDEFQFVWKKLSSEDVTITADIAVETDGEGHRKGLLMIRQSLDGDSAYVDVARHGDGLTSLQFRDAKGAITREVEANISGPTKLRLEKQGDRFYVWIATAGQELQFAGGSTRVEIKAPFYVGLGACAHKRDAVVKVAFSNVHIETTVKHAQATYSTVETVLQSGDARSGYVSTEPITSAGWSEDGKSLTFQKDGKTIQEPFTPLKTAAPVGVPIAASASEIPNEYEVLDGQGQSQMWRKPENAYLSPDGKLVAFVSDSENVDGPFKDQYLELRLLSLADHKIKTITKFFGGPGCLGPHPWSPDGKRIVFISYQATR